MELRGGLICFGLGFGLVFFPLLNFWGDGKEESFFIIETLVSFSVAGCFLIILG